MEFRQKQNIMLGIFDKQTVRLSAEEIKKMKQDYVGMYYGFVSINWGQGMTLGRAWQKALEQMDAFVATKTKITNHPANKDFLKMHSDFRRDMAKSIMTSEYANDKLEPKYRKGFIAYGTKRVKETKNALDSLYQKYMPKQNLQQTSNAKSFDIAKQKTQQLMQQILMQQIMNQRAA